MSTRVTGKCILIVGINYYPEETGNAPYTTGIAEHLAANGNTVQVIAGMPYYPEWRVPATYGRRLRASEQRNGVLIRRFRTYIPPRQSALHRCAFEAGFFVNGLLTQHPVPPDAIIGVVPSLSGAGLASMMAKRFSVPYGLIFQDLVGAAARQSGMPGGGSVARITTALEGRAARGAQGIAIISKGFRAYLEDLGVQPDRIRHIPNWTHISPPTRPPKEVRQELGWKSNEVILLHSGAMGLKQGLENVIHAAQLALAVAPSLRFVLMGDGNQRAMLQERARGLTNVIFKAPSEAADFPNILAAADMLLINERASLRDMALPSKLTSYLVAGRPIVAAVSPEGWTAREVERTGAGVVVPPENPESLIQMVNELMSDTARVRNMGEAGPRYARTALSAPVILDQAQEFVLDILDSSMQRKAS